MPRADLIRVDANDNWETIIGYGGRSEWDSGFNYPFNAYLWQLAEHDGRFYAGRWDMSSAVSEALRELQIDNPYDLFQLIQDLLSGEVALPFAMSQAKESPKREPVFLDRLIYAGGDLYKSPVGVHWSPVFLERFGQRA